MTQQQSWECAEARISLGVYVLGAIDPAERAMVDAHLATCRECRDELAGLASLPALLARVSPEELARIEADEGQLAEEEPPPELIGTVLNLAAARRRRTRWRYAAAAAAIVAVLGGVFGIIGSSSPTGAAPGSVAWWGPGPMREYTATSHVTGAYAAAYLAARGWGTGIAVKVEGIPVFTHCELWATLADGRSVWVMDWNTQYDEGTVGYTGSVSTASSQITSLTIKKGNQTLVTIPT
jgi:hypothetical protein